MSTHRSKIHDLLRDLEGAFDAFEKGQRGKLFDSRDALVDLSGEVKAGGWSDTVALCDLTAKVLGRVLREGTLDERAALGVVRDLLALVESQITQDPEAKHGGFVSDGAGGVFRVVNESRLGELLVKMGKLHPAQVQQALVLQRVSKDKRFGEVLIAMNAIDQRTLEQALDAQHSEARTKPAAPGMPGTGLKLAPLPDLPTGHGPGTAYGAPQAPLPRPPEPRTADSPRPLAPRVAPQPGVIPRLDDAV
jgi:hypothetical protein